MKRFVLIGFVCSVLATNLLAQKQYTYESIPNDPIKVRIYTLDNGLKVYMSVNKEEPKIQITVATNAGSKLDPAETTGLAHYFEHLMFKGTKNFGTTNYEAEEPLLDKIEELFEVYRKTTDERERNRIFARIDSISQVASTYAIANEYDKMMTIIGSTGTNAGTWIDGTNYYENIPSNQFENFLIIQADRFQNPVLRLFHTELETIYEEKNMTLSRDGLRLWMALMEGLFPNHPYGTQTTIGTQENLRNPSITNVKKFFDTYYVPNNMAIVMAGDFDPDECIALIDKHFGQMKSSPLPEFTFTPEEPITAPVVKEVVGKDAENLSIAWRMDNIRSEEIPVMLLAEMVLTNGHAGLVDLNINQKQRLLSAGSHPVMFRDYSYIGIEGSPKKGQTLEDVREILLEQIDLLQKGEFQDWLLQACINDLRLREIKQFETNRGRTSEMEDAFCLDIPWKDKVNLHDEMEKITKQQIMDFAKKYLGRNNYVIVYKRQGKPTDFDQVKKPKVTPIKINRDDKSDFVKAIENNKVTEIQPVFIDFQKDLNIYDAQNDVKMFYTKNIHNEMFTLNYVVDIGSYQDKYLNMASSYLEYLGTDKYTPAQIKEEFYKLGCEFGMWAGGDRSYVTVSGLSKNMEAAMELFEHLLHNAKPNEEALDNLVKDVFKERENAKSNQNAIFSYLVAYGVYGKKSPVFHVQLTAKELNALKSEMLINKLKEWISYKHFAIYYGPDPQEKVISAINKIHNPKELRDVPPEKIFPEDVPQKDRVYVIHYEIPQQAYLASFSFGSKFQKEFSPKIRLYNEYFGGGMSSIVFQEMREARALAYHAMSQYQSPSDLHDLYYNLCFIVCGTDKLQESVETFNELLMNMPENDASFTIAKNAAVDYYRTNRVAPKRIVWHYLAWQKLGLTEDPRKDNFDKIQTLNFQDIKQFHTDNVAGQPRTFLLLGDTKNIDMNYLKKIGKVKLLKLEEIFGF